MLVLTLCHYPRWCHFCSFLCNFKSFLQHEVLRLLSTLFTLVTHALQSTTASVHGMKDERKLLPLHAGQLEGGSRPSVGSSLMHPLDFMFCCLVEVEDSIGVKRLFLGISSYLSGKCFVSKLVFCCRSRREQNLQMCIKVVWKDPHFHQKFHFMYVFSCFPRFAFFYTERIWKGTVNNSVIQWHFHDINIFFFCLTGS